MDSDEELFIENKTRLRSSFEQLILKYSNVSSQEIEEYDLNTGEGYVIPNPLDPSLRNISHNAENLWKFPDFKDFVPEQSQAEEEEIYDVSASNSENEDSISDNNSESDISSGEDEESISEEETFSSEAELSEAENIETILDNQPFEDELNLKTNFSTDHDEAKSVSLKDKGDLSYTTKLEANLLASEDLECDFDKELSSPDVKLSDSDYPEDHVDSIHCKSKINLKTKCIEESKENDPVNWNEEFENQKNLTSELVKKNVHRIERNSSQASSNKKRKSTLKYSKVDLSKIGPEMEKSSARKFEEADSLEDVGPILVDWKLDISYSDSESSSDEKDTPSSTQGDKSERDVKNNSNENNTIKISDKACSKNLNLSERHLSSNQILIESTEKSGLNDDSNLGTDEKPVSVKGRSKKISSKSISKVDKVDDNKSDKKAATVKTGPKRKSRGVSITAVEPISSKSNSIIGKVDDNSESKACDGIKCEKMFCLMCDSLNS